jgi:hypothetical protein
MLKFITTKSVTVAAAAIVAGGMAIFVILAPPAKPQPQVVSADVEHGLAKGDRLRPLVNLFGAELAKLRSKLSVRPAHVGRSGPPGAGARFGEGWQPA